MTLDRAHFQIARMVLETVTPLSIGTGEGDGTVDNLIVRDANGLPAIPGSSFAGVLRHLFRREDTEAGTVEVEGLFGIGAKYGRNPENTDEKEKEPPFGASRVHVSWGCLHDSEDRPVEGLLLGAKRKRLDDDEILRDAAGAVPLKRDHVRIDRFGTAQDTGQFNRVSLRKGHRFSIELSLWTAERDNRAWLRLLELLGRPDFRLGGKTRAGLGAVRVVRIFERTYDLRNQEDFKAFGQLSPNIGNTVGLRETKTPKLGNPPLVAKLSLRPEDYFRFGQGEHSFSEAEKAPDLLPVSERIVTWTGDGKGRDLGKLGELELLIPASAVKGAIRHRFTYHYRALEGQFAEEIKEGATEAEDCAGVKELFGFVPDGKDKDGLVGSIMLDDLHLKPKVADLMHNGIDRFTGGVRDRVLYGEEIATSDSDLTLELVVAAPEEISTKTRIALQKTLEDLVSGRLALGAGGSRGLGYFNGSITWSDQGAWAKGETP